MNTAPLAPPFVPLHLSIFSNSARVKAVELLVSWPEDQAVGWVGMSDKEREDFADILSDLDFRATMTRAQIQHLLGGGSPEAELRWLKAMGVLEGQLEQTQQVVTFPHPTKEGSVTKKSFPVLSSSIAGPLYALTVRGRDAQRRLLEIPEYAQMRITTPRGPAPCRVFVARRGEGTQADSPETADFAGAGVPDNHRGEVNSELTHGRDAGGESGAGGASSTGLPSFLSDAGTSEGAKSHGSITNAASGALYQPGKTESRPNGSDMTQRNPGTPPRTSKKKA